MKKTYLMPSIDMVNVKIETVLAGASKFDPTKDSQDVTPSDEPYDGEFSSKRNQGYSVWDDDFDEEDY